MQEQDKGQLFEAIPLLSIPILAISVMSYMMSPENVENWLASQSLSFPLSGNAFTIDGRFIFLILCTLVLMWEILRAAYNHSISMQNHAYSVVVFLASAFAFTQFAPLQTQLFLFLVVLTFIDVFAGFYITAKTRSRKVDSKREVVHIRADIGPEKN